MMKTKEYEEYRKNTVQTLFYLLPAEELFEFMRRENKEYLQECLK